MKHELLSPAGNLEAGYAALYYGADAVYLGLNKFSARAGAQNFTFEELNEFTAYAHHLGKKVFVALNTILSEKEIDELPPLFSAIEKAHVDALIVQDLGVIYLAKKLLPNIELHASTQMAVHNLEGAKFLYEQGFKRVVLARELTINEIKEIASTLPNLDLEVFIHGALCYSYSGQCLFSALEYNNSANKGRCLYPCRNEFEINDCKKSHLFSMKDLALEEKIKDLPVLSLKIEGRKKSPLYVAAVTNYYRHILDGKNQNVSEAEDIKQIFSRPWCKFHFMGKDKNVVDENFVGHRGLLVGKVEKIINNRLIFETNHKISRFDGLQIDVKGDEKPFGFGVKNLFLRGKSVFEVNKNCVVEIELPTPRPTLEQGNPIYLASSSEVKGKYDYTVPKTGAFRNLHKLDVRVEVNHNLISASVENITVSINGLFSPAKDIQQVTISIQKAFEKTGGTDFTINSIEIINPKNLFIPISTLNELRRNLLNKIILPEKDYTLPIISPYIKKNKCEEISIKHIELTSKQYDFSDITDIKTTWFILPQICRNINILKDNLKELYKQGVRNFIVENYYALELLKAYKDIHIMAGSFIYVMNRYATQMLKEFGVTQATIALESSIENSKTLVRNSAIPLCEVIKSRPPLFTSAVCISHNDCKNCHKDKKTYKLKNNGKYYTAEVTNCQTQVFADTIYERELIEETSFYFSDKNSYM